MHYPGDCSGDYDHGRGTGLVGKVVGPDARGRWHVIDSAEYDAARDRTAVHTVLLQQPSQRLDEVIAQ